MANAPAVRQDSNTRPVYDGATRKLVIAFDIGTTFSGASYRWAIYVCMPALSLMIG